MANYAILLRSGSAYASLHRGYCAHAQSFSGKSEDAKTEFQTLTKASNHLNQLQRDNWPIRYCERCNPLD